MNTKWVKDFQDKLELYQNRQYSLDALKGYILNSAGLLSHEHRKFRRYLEEVEAELDALQFTVNKERLHTETVKVLKKLELKLQSLID